MPQPPNDEAAKKLCRELCALIKDGEFNALLARVDDIKSICADANKDGRTVDQTLDGDEYPEEPQGREHNLGVAAADPKVEKDFPVGHHGRFVELLYRCGYSFDEFALEQIVLADNREAFEFLVFERLRDIRCDEPFHSPEVWISEMCREYVPDMSTPSYLPDDVVRVTAAIGSTRNFSFWDAIDYIIATDSEAFQFNAIGDFIFEETEIRFELGGFSTRDLFECAMMSFDGHEYKTDLTGLTEGDNPRLKEKFYACKGEIRAKLDEAINANESLRTDATVARGYYGTSHLSRAQENAVRQFIQEVVA